MGFLRAHAQRLGLRRRFWRLDLYYHLPEGGSLRRPSAGSRWRRRLGAHDEPALDTAITGGLTLTGLVLPVGGLREKLLAAQRQGLVRVIYPSEINALPRSYDDARACPCGELLEALEVLWGDPSRAGVRLSLSMLGLVDEFCQLECRGSTNPICRGFVIVATGTSLAA